MRKFFLISLFSVGVACPQSHSVSLSWSDTNPIGTTFNLYRAVGTCLGNPTFTKITSNISTKNTVDTAVSVGSYCYYVTAVYNSAESLPSDSAPANILPTKPTAIVIISQ